MLVATPDDVASGDTERAVPMSPENLFDPTRRQASARHVRVHALCEPAFTLVDSAAAFLFVVGSVLFFEPSTIHAATWCFLVGSVCFALKSTTRAIRELHPLGLGDAVSLVTRAAE